MRVTILSHLFPSTDEPLRGPFVAEQARALSAYAEVDVVCGEYHGTDRTGHYDGIPVRYLGLPRNEHLPSKLALLLSAATYVRKARAWLGGQTRQPDIVHAHYGFPDGVVGMSVARSLGVPGVVTLHGDDANIQLAMPVVGGAVATALASASAIVCVSEAMRTQVAAAHPALADKLIAVPNGYDTRDIGIGLLPDAEARDGVGGRGPLLFVGALLPVKNPDLLVRAYARAAGRIGRPLHIAGEGPMRAEIEELAAALGVSDRVRFLGRLSRAEVGEAMRRAHALVLPSRHEGMPIVVIEALASGLPVVASAVGGIPELVRDPGLGVLVDPGDERALADALAVTSAHQWDRRSIAARAPVLTWQDNARILAGIYDRARSGMGVPARVAGGIGD